MRSAGRAAVERVDVEVFEVPTPEPESDGTLEWDSTTIVVVQVHADGQRGLGYSYGSPAIATVVHDTLTAVVCGSDPLATGRTFVDMVHAIRNQGRPGVVASAISAVDIALWDLKARLLGISVADAIGPSHLTVPIYGSGGFTSYDPDQLTDQLGGWARAGMSAVKMKVGRDADADPGRVEVARRAIGEEAGLFVDANGAYTRSQARAMAERFAESGVSWFEEPVSSDDLAGLRLVRDQSPAGMDVTAGEYGYDLGYFASMLAAGAVDCLQVDVTRCGGITEFLRVGALADAAGVSLSAHCAPQVSAHACAGIHRLRHLEYFVDHVRVESLLFEGVLEPDHGMLRPDPDRPGLGIELRAADAERYRS